MIEAVVHALPKAMGSKVAGVTKDGRAYMRDQGTAKLRTFQAEMKSELRRVAPAFLLAGPVSVGIRVKTLRPKSHYGTGRNAAVLRSDAPTWVFVKPDVDKLARAVLDCATGIIWRDDAQVASLSIEKQYTQSDPSVTFRCMPL